MNYPAAELRGIKMNFYLINPDAEHRGILLIKNMLCFLLTYNSVYYHNKNGWFRKKSVLLTLVSVLVIHASIAKRLQ